MDSNKSACFKLCSYCLKSGELTDVFGLGQLCETCLESWLVDQEELHQLKQKAITPTATKEKKHHGT